MFTLPDPHFRLPERRLGAWMLTVLCAGAGAQTAPPATQIPAVTVSAKANPNPVEKSYRKMVKGVDLFQRENSLAPLATLRFKLLPRKHGTDMNTVTLAVIGETVDYTLPIAADHTFELPRDGQAYDQDAQVVPNRRKLTMTWRTDIRTPGLPPHIRRLGDLRLECRVGMEAGLISNSSSLLGKLVSALVDTPAYCDKQEPLYLFFADKPLRSVALVDGARKRIWTHAQLYAQASGDPGMQDNLSYCDCEVLLDRTYILPLGDSSWPDDSLVEFEYLGDKSPAEAR
ncbi:MAG: hypothetical protein V4627_17750 [Pseudomonadota bacterium]